MSKMHLIELPVSLSYYFTFEWLHNTKTHVMYIGGQSAAFLLSILIKDKNIKQCGFFCFVFRLFAVFT